MFAQKTIWMLVVSVAIIAIGSLVFVGTGLSGGFAQIYDENAAETIDGTLQEPIDDTIEEATDIEDASDAGSTKSWSGNVDSLVVDQNNAQFILGGEWTLSIDEGRVTDFNADIDMTPADGNGSAHTHRIVIAEEATELGTVEAPQSGDLQVEVVPAEQSIGGSVLINATGLSEPSDVTVKVGNDMIVGLTEPDENGTVLYALGITEDMMGTVEVNVEGENGDTGSASLTVTESVEEENATSTSANETADIGQVPTNATETSGNATAQSQLGDILSNTTSIEGGMNGLGSNTTESEITAPTSGLLNETEGVASNTANASSADLSDAAGIEGAPLSNLDNGIMAVTDGNSTTFTATATIYTNGEIMWEDVDITFSVINGETLELQIDPEATEGHFGTEPVVGVVQSDGSASFGE